MRRLLRDCWLYDYHARPSMEEVKVLLEEMCKVRRGSTASTAVSPVVALTSFPCCVLLRGAGIVRMWQPFTLAGDMWA